MNERRLHAALVAAALAAFAATRALHPVQGLGNPDIGGILYSADLLRAGLLPYQDSVDVKQPGSFFLVAAIFGVSRSLPALHAGFAAWLLFGAPAMWVAARALYREGPYARHAPAVAVALYLGTAGVFDLNYGAWMMPVYAWSFALLARGLATGGAIAHVLAGAAAACAYLVKAQAVVLIPLFAAIFFVARRERQPGATWRAWPLWILGVALALAPLVALYAGRDALPALARGLVPLGDAAAYTEQRSATWRDLDVLWKVPRQHGRAFYLPLVLGGAAVIGVLRTRADGRPAARFLPVALFYALSLWGCALGGRRFFIHYLPQCLPAACLLGAHPAAWEWLAARRATLARRWVLIAARAHATAAAGLLILLVARIALSRNALVDNPGSTAVVKVGELVRASTAPNERLLVWGWSGWGAYYFSERRSPSSVFKVLGQVTEYNDNSAFDRGSPIRFKPGPLADRLLADLEREPPAFLVRSVPFFPGKQGDPLDEWPELRAFVARRYKIVARVDHLVVYERKDRRR